MVRQPHSLHSHIQLVPYHSNHPQDWEQIILQMANTCCEGSAECGARTLLQWKTFLKRMCGHYPPVNIYKVVVMIWLLYVCRFDSPAYIKLNLFCMATEIEFTLNIYFKVKRRLKIS
jgi:hypothetical protein